ncbi:DNA methylase [Candidatus Woesearchaeota archaeon]|nr:DNA methylase [Candidatus Woesearchaeota archaeon]|tara:strand:- start:11723 stop:12385 length:663 start_codon:yes stop_codon:yes gene_type:complete
MSKSESSNRSKIGQIGSKGALAVALSRLEGFIEPKVRVEQYVTDAEVAAEVLWNMGLRGDVGKVSVDLGCGTGILGIGLMLLGKVRVLFVDSDKGALEVAKRNLKKIQSEYKVLGEAEFLLQDVKDFNENVNLVVENPPFGVKNKHADRVFLKKAFEVGNVVYSFHKSESREFISKFSSENGFKVTNIFDFEFPLKATLSYHTRKIKRIKVSCFRLEKIQ